MALHLALPPQDAALMEKAMARSINCQQHVRKSRLTYAGGGGEVTGGET